MHPSRGYLIGLPIKTMKSILLSRLSVWLLLFSVVLTLSNIGLMFYADIGLIKFRDNIINFQIIIQILVAYILVSKRILHFILIGFDKILTTLCRGIKYAVVMELGVSIMTQILILAVNIILSLLILWFIDGGIAEAVKSAFNDIESKALLLMVMNIALIQIFLSMFAVVLKNSWGLIFAVFILLFFTIINARIADFYYTTGLCRDSSTIWHMVINRLAYGTVLFAMLLVGVRFYKRSVKWLINSRVNSKRKTLNYKNNFVNILFYQIKYSFFSKGYFLIILLLVVLCVIESEKLTDSFGNGFVLSSMVVHDQISGFEIFPAIYALLVIFVIGELFKYFKSNRQVVVLVTPITNQQIIGLIASNFTFFWLLSIALMSIANFIVVSVLYHFDIEYLLIIIFAFIKYYFSFLFAGYGLIFVYALFNNRIISIVCSIVTIYMFSILWFYTLLSESCYVPLINFAYSPYNTYSDMNSSVEPIYVLRVFLFITYWLSLCYCLLLLASIVFKRIEGSTLYERIRNVGVEVRGLKYKFAIGVLLIVISGGLLCYYISINNRNANIYFTVDGYDSIYGKYLYREQPEIVTADFEINFGTDNRTVDINASYKLKNLSQHLIDTVLLSFPINKHCRFRDILLNIEGDYEIVTNDSINNIKILKLVQGLCNGDSLLLQYNYTLKRDGFEVLERDINLVGNGSFLESKDIAMEVGYDLSKCDKVKRVPIPNNEREKQFLLNRYLGSNCTRRKDVNLKICCSAEKHVIASGDLKSVAVNGETQCREFTINQGFMHFGVFMANYDTISKSVNGLTVNVFFDSQHRKGAEHLLKAAEQIMLYCNANFGNSIYKDINIVETTTYRSGGTCFHNTIALQENYFTSDFSDNGHLKLAYVMLAHELAHIWWGHKLVAANIQGSRVITEGLAEYTAIRLISHLQSDSLRDVYVKRIKSRYEEQKYDKSLIESTTEEYLTYRKGGLAFYGVSNLIGEKRLNKILKDFTNKETAKCSGKYVAVQDLVNYIMEQSSDEESEIIFELFFGKDSANSHNYLNSD